MAEELKGLIEKIQQEGIKAAEDKAKEITAEARQQAEAMMQKAKAEAEKIIAQAKEANARREESTKATLKQAGRDLLLSLRKEINAMLDKIILSQVRQALSTEEVARIISTLVKEYGGKDKTGAAILLSKEEIKKLEGFLLGQLNESLRKGITLKPAEDISGGFIISFDQGKSHFDFTDQALAEYIGTSLKPKLREYFET